MSEPLEKFFSQIDAVQATWENIYNYTCGDFESSGDMLRKVIVLNKLNQDFFLPEILVIIWFP